MDDIEVIIVVQPSSIYLNSDCTTKIGSFSFIRSSEDKGSGLDLTDKFVSSRWNRSPELLLGSR